MGDLDIGLAMVTARIANAEMQREKEEESRKKRETRPSPGRGRRAVERPFPGGVELEVVKGNIVLIPTGELARNVRRREWTVTPGDGTVVRIDTGEAVRPSKDD